MILLLVAKVKNNYSKWLVWLLCKFDLTHTSLVLEMTTLANFPKPVVTPYTTRKGGKGREREREIILLVLQIC